MKSIYTLILLLVVPALMLSQSLEEKSQLVNNGEAEFGISILSSSMNNQSFTMLGGFGMHKVSNHFSIGGGGFGAANNTAIEIDGENRFLKFAYVGGIVGYSNRISKLFSYNINCLIGGGNVEYDKYSMNNLIFVNDLGISGNINVIEQMQISLGFGYRAVQGSNIEGLSDSNLSNPYWGITFKLVGM